MSKINKLDLLIAFYIFGVMVSELMGAKTFPVAQIGNFHLNASVAVFVIPLLFSATDVIVEAYGKERARSVVRSGLITIVLLTLYILLATKLPPSTRFAPTELAYDTIFAQSARIAIASLAAFASSEFLDVYIFSKIRERMGKHALWFRNNASNFISQFVDSTVFMFLAFYAVNRPVGDNLTFLFGLILPYWLLRCLLSIIETPLVYWGVAWLKRDNEVKS